jgi:hypothetical protein
MEARRPLKEQELFYAKLEGKHSALDDVANKQFSYNSFIQLYRYNNKVLIEYIRSYHESRHASSSNTTDNKRSQYRR